MHIKDKDSTRRFEFRSNVNSIETRISLVRILGSISFFQKKYIGCNLFYLLAICDTFAVEYFALESWLLYSFHYHKYLCGYQQLATCKLFFLKNDSRKCFSKIFLRVLLIYPIGQVLTQPQSCFQFSGLKLVHSRSSKGK